MDPEARHPRKEHLRVLLAEGGPALRSHLRPTLEAAGDLRIVAAAGGADHALDLAAEFRPDVAVIDLRLPAPDLGAVVRSLRRRAPGTGVIVLGEEDLPGEGAASPDAVLAPGIPAGEILSWVRRVGRLGRGTWGPDEVEELRNRVAVIEGFAELLAREPGGSGQAAHVERILRQARAVRGLIERLSPAPALPRWDLALHPVPTDLARLVRSTAAATARAGSAGRVEVAAPPVLAAVVDAATVQAAVAALLAVAAPLAPPGSPVVVHVGQEGDDATVVVSVEVAEPARQPVGVVTLFRGRAIARAHGGDLTLSADPSGTRFVLRLPLAGPPARTPPPAS